uniref:Uncharacterized protein n=1 Tax=Acrobeloides nanus TaxID=290746 RepID=A0A914C492_9BILA
MPPPRTPQTIPHSQPSTFFQFPPTPSSAQALAITAAILSPRLTSPFFSHHRNSSAAALQSMNMSFSGKLNRSPDPLKTPIPTIHEHA